MLTDQVFISHTSDMAMFPPDRPFVRAAVDGVIRAGMAPVDMGYFAARDGQPADYCRERVRECELYIAVIGFRYGSIVPGETVSYTELEFIEASAARLPRLVFLLDENAEGPTDADRRAAGEFRARLRGAGLITASFAKPDGLELAVYHALMEQKLAGGRQTAPAVRFSLPPDAAAFTGRHEEMERVTAAVTGAATGGGVVTVRAIGGMPGVGKTALAVHAAHQLRGACPDRQLFLDLHAHTPGRDPVAPQDALANLLVATGVDPRFVPADLEARTAMWRDRMARQRALLVLDNAASSSQVTPLLPGDGGCVVLITSRRHLGDMPGAVVQVLVGALPPQQAHEMFTRLAPHGADDPAGVAEVIRLAGFLPLAISLLARVLARHPAWTMADLAAETREKLLTFSPEDNSVAAAFEVSYRHLDTAQQRFFRLLGLHPGTAIDGYAAAALAGLSPGQAEERLEALHGEGLVSETTHRRYGMHDLLRRYARDRIAADPEVDQALDQLLDYYEQAVARADARIARQTRPGLPPPMPTASAMPPMEDAGQALAWARAERDSLLGCLDQVTSTGQHARVTALTAALAELMQRDGPWAEAITRHATAVQAARHLGDRFGQANALHNLGTVRQPTGDYRGAAVNLEEALAIYRDLCDKLGQANALHNLGTVRRLTGDYLGAADILQQALTFSRDVGDKLGQANALHNLGIVRRLMADYQGAAGNLEEALAIYRYLDSQLGQANALLNLGAVRRLTGDYLGAADALQQALAISRDLGDQSSQANALFHLGDVRRGTGDYLSAAGYLENGLAIFRDLGDKLGQANTLTWLGGVRRETGDYLGAVGTLEQGQAIYRDLGDRLGQANTLLWLGVVRQSTGDHSSAAGALEQALAIYREIGSRPGQANTLNNLGTVQRETGDYPGAADALERALAIFRDIGNQDGQADVLNEMGMLRQVTGESADAEACHQQALELARTIGSSPNEARALAGLGRCAATAGQPTKAKALLQQAHEIFQRIGATDAHYTLAEPDALTSQAPRDKPKPR